jgi:4-amino-4-deoxy-L-arabinose transferase-like glycosyltransferase
VTVRSCNLHGFVKPGCLCVAFGNYAMNSTLSARYRALLQVDTLPVALGTVAFLVGLGGEALLFKDRWRVLGAVVVGVAMLAGALAWRGVHESFAPDEVPTVWGGSRETALRLAGVAGSLFLFLGSLLAWQADPGQVFGLQGTLWLCSIGLLAVSCWRWASKRVPGAAAELSWTRSEAAIFAGIVALSLFTHLAWLGDIPWRFNADEFTAYNEAMRFYQGPPISLFTTSWYGTGMPSMPMAISGELLHLVGTGLGGVRASTALFGALAVIPLYGLARLLQGRTFAALAAFCLAVSAADIHYSRVSLPNMLTPFFWTVCFYFLLRGLQSSRPSDFAWTGLFAGFSMYTYYATRLLPYLLIAYVVYLALFHRRVFRGHLGHFGIAIVGFLVGFGPLLAYFIKNPGVWAGRGFDELVVPAVIPDSWGRLLDDVSTVVPLIWRNFLGLSVIPSQDHVYWGSFLLPVEAVLALIGTAVLIWRWRQPGSFLVLLWGAVTLFISGPLIAESVMPAYVHWVAAFPAIYMAMALPPALWLRTLRYMPSRWPVAGRVIVTVGAVAIAVANIYFYLALYPARVPAAFESAQGRFLATLDAHDRVYFVGNSGGIYYPAASAMLAPQVVATELLNPGLELPLPADPAHDLVFAFNNDEARYLPVIEGIYPGGQAGRIETPGGPIGRTYKVTAEEAVMRGALWPASPASGLKISWQGSNAGTKVDPFVGAPMLSEQRSPTFEPFLRPAIERDPNFVPLGPLRAQHIVWEGEVYADGGLYVMNLRTDGHAQLMLDGQVVIDLSRNAPLTIQDFFGGRWMGTDARISLATGWHPVKLSLEPTGNFNGMEWSWTRPDGVQEIVPPWVLRHE